MQSMGKSRTALLRLIKLQLKVIGLKKKKQTNNPLTSSSRKEKELQILASRKEV